MSKPFRSLLLLLTLAVCGAGPIATASASTVAIIKDCQDNGKIDGTYSQKDYANTLKNIPTDVNEYTDCADVISRARLAAAGGGGAGGTGGGTGATPGGAPAASSGTQNVGKSPEQVLETATPAERRQVAQARQAGAPVQVGGRKLSPVISGLSPAGAANVLPTPLVVALILLGLGVAAAAGWLVRSRVLARRLPSP